MKEKSKIHKGLQITYNTTEDCNLRCKYCYEINKRKKTLPLEYAKKFTEIILTDKNPVGVEDELKKDFKNGLTVDFIGGDSLIDVDWLNTFFEFFIEFVNTNNDIAYDSWRENYRFSICSNGTLFNDKVKQFCEYYKDVLSLGVSIDGCKELHDKNRIFPDGSGSMDAILKDWDWYKKINPSSVLQTKSTLSRESIPYIYSSLKYMFETLDISEINQNFIMENTYCEADDYKELVNQMNKCIEYILNNRHNIYWSMIDLKMKAEHKRSEDDYWFNRGHCGSGAMPCLGINGNIYPCFRWMPHTQSKCNPEPIVVGDIWKGLYNKDGFRQVREGAYRCNCTKEEKCKTCPYESACSYCIGGCYAEFQEFRRTTYICELTKIQCEYAKRYWNEYNKLENVLDENGSIKYYPIDRHYDVDKYYYDPEHIYNPE